MDRQSSPVGYDLKTLLILNYSKTYILTLTPEANRGIRSHDKVNACSLFLVKESSTKFTWCEKKVPEPNIVGLSGGILLMWDYLLFDKCADLQGSHFIGVIRNWTGISKKVGLLNIYSPQSLRDKEVLWHDLISTMHSTDAMWVLFGDLNTVRPCDERFGTTFVEKDARIFNDFIALGGLHDFPLGGRRFTRFNRKRDEDLMDMQLLELIERESIKQKSRVK
ncbi:RNA-directed DNA polymerase, eukaryota [Tanacetum coccineum]